MLCDRFVSSTLAYQLGGEGLTAGDIKAVAEIAIQHRWPELTVILDMPARQINRTCASGKRSNRAAAVGLSQKLCGPITGRRWTPILSAYAWSRLIAIRRRCTRTFGHTSSRWYSGCSLPCDPAVGAGCMTMKWRWTATFACTAALGVLALGQTGPTLAATTDGNASTGVDSSSAGALSLSPKIDAAAVFVLKSMRQTKYVHKSNIEESKGIYDVDCSGLVDCVVKRVSPQHLAEIEKLRTHGRQLAEDYYEAFSGESNIPGWVEVKKGRRPDARRHPLLEVAARREKIPVT